MSFFSPNNTSNLEFLNNHLALDVDELENPTNQNKLLYNDSNGDLKWLSFSDINKKAYTHKLASKVCGWS